MHPSRMGHSRELALPITALGSNSFLMFPAFPSSQGFTPTLLLAMQTPAPIVFKHQSTATKARQRIHNCDFSKAPVSPAEFSSMLHLTRTQSFDWVIISAGRCRNFVVSVIGFIFLRRESHFDLSAFVCSLPHEQAPAGSRD